MDRFVTGEIMVDSDDGSTSRRESHYNQQRSSLPRSEHSARNPSRPQSRSLSRPQSRRTSTPIAPILTDVDDYILQDTGGLPYIPYEYDSPPSSPSPAPTVPRVPTRRQSLEKKRRPGSGGRSGTGSGHGSSRSTPRKGSRGRNIEEILQPDTWEELNEVDAPSPVKNPNERRMYQHSTLEEERTDSRNSKTQHSKRSFYPSQQHTGVNTGRLTPGSTLDITALPHIGDNQSIPAQSAHSGVLTELYAISYLIFFSILGTLARLGLQWLTFYPGAPITFSNLWANVAGTFVLGFLAEDRRLFRQEWGNSLYTPPRAPRSPQNDEEKAPEAINPAGKASHNKTKKTIPLYIGLATGFCGSFTSFSTFMRDTFLAFINDLPAPVYHPGTSINSSATLQRNDGYSFMAGLAVIILTLGTCHAALKLGAHIAVLLDAFTPTLPFRFTRRILDPIVVFLAWGSWLGAVFMAIWPPDGPHGPSSRGPWSNETWRGQAIFACVFASVGCILRFYISLLFNPLIPSFPLGTFAVNIFGTAVLGMAYDLQHVALGSSGVGGGRVVCQVLQGLMDGFCGALTTVSTWVLELEGLKRRCGVVYAGASVWVGVLVLVAVMGSVKWTVGWEEVAC
ncbi:hypothetical protein CC80DRAFT_443126, partial [Byssothecium circinans]